jgi:hypothetical protein
MTAGLKVTIDGANVVVSWNEALSPRITTIRIDTGAAVEIRRHPRPSESGGD